MTALSILAVGLLLGMQHATEVDHLAAVATLATRQSSLTQTLRQGVAWGIGHTLTLVLFGGVVLWLGQAISPRLGQALETAVGIMLVLLGADVLRRLVRDRTHFHVHRHGLRLAHVHAHSHRGEGAHAGSAHRHAHPQRWPVRALAVGMMHGLAGSAALVLLTMQSIASVGLGVGYIAPLRPRLDRRHGAAVRGDRGPAQAFVGPPDRGAPRDDGRGRRLQLRPRRRHGGGDRLPQGAARLNRGPAPRLRQLPRTLLAAAQSHALAHLGVDPGARLHERVHAVAADVHQLEAGLGRQLLHLRVGVERGE